MEKKTLELVESLSRSCSVSQENIIDTSLNLFRYLRKMIADGYSLVVVKGGNILKGGAIVDLPKCEEKDEELFEENSVEILACLLIEAADGNVVVLEKREPGYLESKIVLRP